MQALNNGQIQVVDVFFASELLVSFTMRHRGQQPPYDPSRKLRTREHVIADLSYNFLERKVLERGHWLDAPFNDYGIDATMFHHNPKGEIENGEVRFQLKAKEQVAVSRDGTWISQRVEIKDLRYWYYELYPVILVVYDAGRNRAVWLHVQQYVSEHPAIMESDAETATIRIPAKNTLTVQAIDRFRNLSLETLADYRRNTLR
jgi:hypothetical protein